jgi:hypothetical protein
VHRTVPASNGGSRESLGRAGFPLQQTCALASALLAYVRLCASGGGGHLRSRAPAARPSAGWRGSSPLRSGGAGTTGSGAVRGRTSRPISPAAAGELDQQSRGRGSPWLPCPVRAGGVGVHDLVSEDSGASWSPWGGLAGLPAWYRKLMSSAGRGSWLASLSRAAAAFTTNNRLQDRRHHSWQDSARPAFR